MVVLNNGESLSGTFSRIRENTLVFRTSLQGQMITPLDNVRTLSAGTPLYISMMDDRVYYGRLAVHENGQVIHPLDGGAPIRITVSDIQDTLPIPTPTTGTDPTANGDYLLQTPPELQLRKEQAAPARPDLPPAPSTRPQKQEIPGNGQPNLHLRLSGDSLLTEEDVRDKRDPARDDVAQKPAYNLNVQPPLKLGLYEALLAEHNRSLDLIAFFDAERERRQEPQRFPAGQHRPLNHSSEGTLGLYLHRFFQQEATSPFYGNLTFPLDTTSPPGTVSSEPPPAGRLYLHWSPGNQLTSER